MNQGNEQPTRRPESAACGLAEERLGFPLAKPQAATGRGAAVLAAGIALMTAGALWAYYLYHPSVQGPEQPLPFSHRFHVTEKRISCVFCHGGAINTARAGVPPVETCMLCHSRIIITYPQIEKLRAHYDQKRPIEWVRVNDVPEFVYFDHEVHVRRGFDCGRCHGDVAHMDRLAPAYDLQMGFCVQCHRDNHASVDCLTCHR